MTPDPARRRWRLFAQDPAVRSDLARRVMILLAEAWEARGVAVVSMSAYARHLSTDTTNIGRALDRLVATGWLTEDDRTPDDRTNPRRALRPGARWTAASVADELRSRGRDCA